MGSFFILAQRVQWDFERLFPLFFIFTFVFLLHRWRRKRKGNN